MRAKQNSFHTRSPFCRALRRGFDGLLSGADAAAAARTCAPSGPPPGERKSFQGSAVGMPIKPNLITKISCATPPATGMAETLFTTIGFRCPRPPMWRKVAETT